MNSLTYEGRNYQMKEGTECIV